MKIVAFELEDWERKAFDRLGAEHQVLLTDKPVTGQVPEAYQDAEAISVFVYSNLDAASLKAFQRLKLVVTRSTGYNHIDLTYCRNHGITVCNVPAYADETVAEHVFALLLSISHEIVESVHRTRSGDFTQDRLQGFDLAGKTIGVIGTGNIGKNVIRIARGFGMNVLAFDLRPDTAAAASLGFKYDTLDNVLAASDIISLHVPGNKRTYHLISRQAFARMKRGCILINTARGDVVDTPALLEALSSRQVAAAGLDVLSEEPLIREEAELLRSILADNQNVRDLFADHMLIHQKNVLVTPHNAFNTREAVGRLLSASIDNIIAFAAGKPQNVVGS